MKRKVIISVFILFITIPLVFTTIYHVFNIKMDVTLLGNFEYKDKPIYSIEKWFGNDYQKSFNEYWNNNFISRAFMVKTYNQLRYTMFNEGNRIIGKDGSVYEENYLSDALLLSDEFNFSIIENRENMDKYVKHLKNISVKLEKIGKHLIVYTTPNKAVFQNENIPEYFQKERVQGKRAIDIFNEMIAETNVTYLNGSEYLNTYFDEEWPIFYNTGIHWSRPAEQIVSNKILDLIGACYDDVSIKKIQLGNLNKDANPYWRDSDVYDLLNIWLGKRDSMYYQYQSKCSLPEKYRSFNILLQGGSFGEGLKKDFLDNKVCFRFSNIFYNTALIDGGGQSIVFDSWNALPLEQELDRSDIIIIEVNEAVLKNYSDGFVEYLDHYLDDYIPKNIDNLYMKNLDCTRNMDMSSNGIYGIYAVENDFCWAKDYAVVQLKNSNIKEKGLLMELTIPQYLSENSDSKDELLIYVNGLFMERLALSDDGRKIIKISSKEINTNSDVYTIEFYTTSSFIPKKLGINDDERVLSIQIHYIGEVF